MNGQTLRTRWSAVVISSFLATVAFLPGFACSGTGYDDAKAKAAAASVLISPDMLNGWITQGYGVDSFGYNRMVILDVTTSATYVAGHIPGSFLLDAAADVNVSRSDGIGGTYSVTWTTGATYTDINSPAMVATSDMMNAVMQRTGIDRNTVVVLAGDSIMNVALAYFNFRYWGFPKERIKVLDRTKALYVTAGHALETGTVPAPAHSSYSVCDLTPNTSLRAALPDMIQVAEGTMPNAIAWDVRNDNEFNGDAGATTGPLKYEGASATAPTKYYKVAFEGHVKGAKHLVYTTLLANAGASILDADTVKTALNAAGVTSGARTYVYCRTGGRAAVGFLILDGMLGYPAALYDASWLEYGQMATKTKGGALEDNSPWRTDTAARTSTATTDGPAYTVDTLDAVTSLPVYTVDSIKGANSYALRADTVNVIDSSTCGGRPGGGGGVAPGY